MIYVRLEAHSIGGTHDCKVQVTGCRQIVASFLLAAQWIGLILAVCVSDRGCVEVGAL